ncbi:MAG: agmatinase [Balneolaceae bacterium]|nr:agmatinase [Balneolaceae bacterium]
MNNILLQGINFDAHSSFQQGPAKAPALIRKAFHSDSGNSYSESLDLIDNTVFHDVGDFDIDAYFDIEFITRDNLKQAEKLLTLGGDHSITYPIMKAYREKYESFDILQIDAHSDLYHDFEGNPYSHACPFARILENKLADRLVQIGVRTLTPHQQEQAEKYDVEVITMQDFDPSNLPKFERPVYLSLDMDGFDPAFAPGVSHHEPGGLSTREVLRIIQSINVPIIGADIVEYNPDRDFQEMTAYLGAKMMKEILAKMI